MARRELKEPVVGLKVIVWIADEDVLVSGIRRHNRKPYELAQSGFDLTFDRAARVLADLLVTHDPLRTENV
jgi:hypothetical protein